MPDFVKYIHIFGTVMFVSVLFYFGSMLPETSAGSSGLFWLATVMLLISVALIVYPGGMSRDEANAKIGKLILNKWTLIRQCATIYMISAVLCICGSLLLMLLVIGYDVTLFLLLVGALITGMLAFVLEDAVHRFAMKQARPPMIDSSI